VWGGRRRCLASKQQPNHTGRKGHGMATSHVPLRRK
jgi:hypothetical protein